MKIAVLPGDGIGIEVTREAVKVLRAVGSFDFEEGLIGGAAFDATGDAFPPATIDLVHRADAVLLGATGTPEDEHRPPAEAVGRSTLLLRRELGLFANFRPAFLYPELAGASSLKPELVRGLDLIVLRELAGDVYYGEPRGIVCDGEPSAFNTMRYSESEILRIGRVAFESARKPPQKGLLGRQGQRARNQRTVARDHDLSGPRIPGRRAHAHVRGRGGHGPDARAHTVRCGGHRQYVR